MKPDGSLVFHVSAEIAGNSLVGALKRWLSDQPWSYVRKLLSSRRIQVNGNLCQDEGRRLTEGEVVKVLANSQPMPPRPEDIKIRFLDSHVAVVEKPSGITSIRHEEEQDWPSRRKQIQPTLDEMLPGVIAKKLLHDHRRSGNDDGPQRRTRQLKKFQEGGPAERIPKVRPVHRLDRETSGLMVFARTINAERHLVQQFRNHTVLRSYLAVVHGEVEAMTIESQLVRDRGDGRRGSTKLPNVGQRAVTHVRPIEKLKGYTVVECKLETGRTHQIRIHMSENGHFVCGDKVYCQPLFKKMITDRSAAPRLALHAKELGFVHPQTGEDLHFTMPLPRDLTQFLERLRSQG